MHNFKHKLYYFISGQLPEYITVEYPQFIVFLKKYYEFLETDNQAHDLLLNSESWIDIDKTLDLFIPHFKDQYAYDISDKALLNLRRLVKNIGDYYEAKGSENATELFFRFMFNEQVEVAYPGDYILRASDGRWKRKRILKLDARTTVDPFKLKGKKINLNYLEYVQGGGTIVRHVTTTCINVVRQIDPEIFQLEVDLSPDYNFPDIIVNPVNADLNGDGPITIESLGDWDSHVYVYYNGEVYGSLTKQIISVLSIDDTGSNFKIDDSYVIGERGAAGRYFASVGTSVYTNEVYVEDSASLNQAVIRVNKILDTEANTTYFLQNYLDDVQSYVKSPKNNSRGINQLQIVTTGHRFNARYIDQNEDVSYFAWETLADSYCLDEDYPTLAADFYATDLQEITPITSFTVQVTPREPRNIKGTPATITFKTGLLYEEPGRFKDSSGFLSDVNNLQDNYYYHPYSYVIRTTQPLNKWQNLYLRSAHPAGFKMFSELQLIDRFTTEVSVFDNLKIYVLKFDEVVVTHDDVPKHVTKVTQSETFMTDSHAVDYEMLKVDDAFAADSAEISMHYGVFEFDSVDVDETQDFSFDYGVNVVETSVVSDSVAKDINVVIRAGYFSEDYISGNYNIESDVFYPADSLVADIVQSVDILETIIATDSAAIVVNSVREISDTIGVSDSIAIQTNYVSSLSDSVSVSDISDAQIVAGPDPLDTFMGVMFLGQDIANPIDAFFPYNVNIINLIDDVVPVSFNNYQVDVTDSTVSTDSTYINITKSLSDSSSLADSATPAAVFTTQATDSATATSSLNNINITKNSSESVSFSESGSIYLDTYAGSFSPTAYFEADYVGTITTF